MLTRRLPYGAEVAKTHTRAAQRKLIYQPVAAQERGVPIWIDAVLRKAVHPNLQRRYEDLSECVYDLRHPCRDFVNRERQPFIERNPVLLWKSLSIMLLIIVVVLLGMKSGS